MEIGPGDSNGFEAFQWITSTPRKNAFAHIVTSLVLYTIHDFHVMGCMDIGASSDEAHFHGWPFACKHFH